MSVRSVAVLTQPDSDKVNQQVESAILTTLIQDADLRRDIEALFLNPVDWLNTPHPELNLHRPVEFLQEGRTQPLRDLIAAIKLGLFA